MLRLFTSRFERELTERTEMNGDTLNQVLTQPSVFPVLSCLVSFFHLCLDAAKTEVITGGTDFAFAARPDHVAGAILVGAEKRAAAVDALFLGWLSGIVR